MTDPAQLHPEPAEALPSRGKIRPMWLVLKMAISLGLIVIVLWKLDFATIWAKSRQVSLALVLSVVLLFVVQTYVAAWRWWVILKHHHLEIPLRTTVRICLIGAFFNQLLPSSIGGDLARAWYVYRNGQGKRIAVITVLSDRICGMLAIAALAITSFPILVHFSVGDRALIMVGIVAMGASSALMAVFWLDRLPIWAQRWTFIRHLGSLSEAARDLADSRSILPLLGLSFLIHAITILAVLLLLDAIVPQLNLVLCAALVPVIMLMSMVPVSIAGWGVREGVMIYGFGLANVPPEAALVVSILIGLSLAAVGLLGGLTWLIQIAGDNPRR